ncbi:MAG: hypothetical protein CMM87_03425 [Rickettsiales bacterium]|nr:hypothetical protein [Rickettsiales bacterium]|tara:strand:+ start:24519 stop:26804 length:2286 start_codon:yes stop_codon:yes gene_type:complete
MTKTFFIFSLLSLTLGSFVVSAEVNSKKPLYLSALSVKHDKNNDTVYALQDVTISDGVETVECDKLTYIKSANKLIAEGNVRYYTKSEDIVTTNSIELSDNFKDGLMDQFGILMKDDSRVTGGSGTKKDEVIEIEKGSFTPCYLCKDDPSSPPLWALKASHVVRNKPAEIVEYYNAHMEIYGVPVFYTPYLYHPDPSIKRRSGFLFPEISRGSRYGTAIGFPYFLDLGQDEDLTITPFPVLESGVGSFLKLEHRRHFGFGKIRTHASIANTYNVDRRNIDRTKDKKKVMGHLFSKGEFNINELWRLRYQLEKMDSQTYLKRYPFLEDPENPITSKNFLDSSFNLERFEGNDYANISGHWFQNLREDEPRKQTPAVIPSLYYQHVTDPGQYGEVWQLTLADIFLTRPEPVPAQINQDIQQQGRARELNRFVADGQFYIPYITPDGSIWSAQANLNARVYTFEAYQPGFGMPSRSGTEGSIFPQLTLGWRKPLSNILDDNREIVIDPTIHFVTSSRGVNSDRFPNEDSQDFEFSETNLFTSNRFYGFDQLDEGTRLNYGIQSYFLKSGRTIIRGFLGQSFSFSRYDHIRNSETKGLQKKFSDYLASLYLSPIQDYSLSTSLLLDRKDLKPKNISASLHAGPAVFKLWATYSYVKDRSIKTPTKPRSHQVNTGFSSKISKEWSATSSMGYDLVSPKKLLYVNFDLTYQNECFGVITSVNRSFFKSRTLRPQTTIMLTFSFKHLGSVGKKILNDKPINKPEVIQP